MGRLEVNFHSIKPPSEPARSVGGTHQSVRQHMTDRTWAP
jgi:hypothetical protein